MPLILLVCAMKAEWSGLKKRIRFKRGAQMSLPVWKGEFVKAEQTVAISLVQIGIGYNRAKKVAPLLFGVTKTKPDLVIHFGIAGGLQEGLKGGDLVMSEWVMDSHGNRIDLSQVAGHWSRVTGPIKKGGLLTSDRILYSSAEKRDAGEKTGAVAVDLETYPIAEEAHRRRIPFLALRAISDPLEWDLSELDGTDFVSETGESRWTKAAGEILKRPSLLFHLPKYQSAFHKATKCLSETIRDLLLGKTGF